MRIAMLGCKGVPASMAHGGGIERHVEQLASGLVERGHDVTVYVRSYTNPRKRKTWKGCKLVTLPTWRRKNLETIIHVFMASFHAIRGKFDIIHYHGVGPSTLSWIPRLFAPNAKVVVTFHSRDQFHEKWNLLARAYLAWGEWTSIRFPHTTIAVSHVIQTFCWRMYQKKPHFIPNGVE
ncbi:glycosyltransferase, partial [Candidatus Uhrbacteria bacterium]|nr:glycosyltransferase [Candidatus Uhrbacteria bacterium]